MGKAEEFLSRQVKITAMLWDGSAAQAGDIIEWVLENDGTATYREINETQHKQHAELRIRTLEGTMAAGPGWWIIKGTEGEFYPCKPSVFEAKYDRITE